MRKKRLIALLGATCLSLAVVACSSSETGDKKDKFQSSESNQTTPDNDKQQGSPVDTGQSDIAGCIDSLPEGETIMAGQAVRDSLIGTTLVFAGGGGTYQEAQKKVFLDPFAACTGAVVLDEAGGGDAKVVAMVEAKNATWDVVAGSRNLANRCDEILEPIDTNLVDLSRIRHTDLVGPCLAPLDIAPVYLAYDPTKFTDNPPTRFADLFDTEKFPGKRSIYGSVEFPTVNEAVAVATMLGFTQETMYEKGFPVKEVFEKIDSIYNDVVWATTYAQQQQIIEAGEASLGFFAAGRVWAAAQNGYKWTPVWGENNWVFAVDPLTVPKYTKNKEAAMALVNYMMGADQQARATELTVYSPTNMDAVPQVPEAMRPYYAAPDEIENGVPTTVPYWLNNPEVNMGMWTDYLTSK